MEDAGTMLAQAMTAVVEGSKEAVEKTDMGFKPGISVLGAYVRAGDTVKYTSQFEAGRKYIVAAGGNDTAEDIDVSILDGDGGVLAKDDSKDPYAVAAMDSESKQKVSYVVTNAGSKAAFVCVAVLTGSSRCASSVCRNRTNSTPKSTSAISATGCTPCWPRSMSRCATARNPPAPAARD